MKNLTNKWYVRKSRRNQNKIRKINHNKSKLKNSK